MDIGVIVDQNNVGFFRIFYVWLFLRVFFFILQPAWDHQREN